MPIAVTNPAGASAYCLYDAALQRVASIDPLGKPTYFYYDLAGRQKSAVNVLGAGTYFVYGARGNRLADVDAVGRPIGRQDLRGTVVYYGYDASGRRTELGVLGQRMVCTMVQT